MLTQAADAGNVDAVRQLISIYLRGIRRQITKDPRHASAVLDPYRSIVDAEELKVQSLLIQAADAPITVLQPKQTDFQRLSERYMKIASEKRPSSLRQPFAINRDAASISRKDT